MNEEMSDLPQAETADPDGVQVALRAAHTLWSRGDTTESLKWLRKAAESASDEGADLRSLQLAKAAAELRGKLFRPSEPPRSPSSHGPSMSTGTADVGGAYSPVAPHGIGQDEAQPAAASMSSFPPAVLPSGLASSGIAPAGFSGSVSSAFADSHEPGSGPAYASGAAHGSEAAPAYAPQDAAGAYGASQAAGDENTRPSRPVTATQYPSHRPRQRRGLTSTVSGSSRDGAYAAVPSWSADSERRVSSAPPPLPQQSLDEYEELEAEPDEEAADDPGSVWSAASDAGFESWRPPEPVPPSTPAGALPPPLPPRGAFAEDEADFSQQPELPTVVIPPVDEGEAAVRRAASASSVQSLAGQSFAGRAGASPSSTSASPSSTSASSALPSHAWDQQARIPSRDPDAGSSWAEELRNGAWGHPFSATAGGTGDDASPNGSSPGAASVADLGLEPTDVEPPPQSETTPAKLTARVHHQAVRVSFAPDLRVPGQYVVRPLREGERAATGERIALLVALEPGVPLV
jgi:hypothetical protein